MAEEVAEEEEWARVAPIVPALAGLGTVAERPTSPTVTMLVKSEDEGPHGGSAKIRVLKEMFEKGPEAVPWERRRRTEEFDYGYALTVHKSQGSQWDKVMLFDESFAFRDLRERWLYTAITRAAEQITIVR